jgi:hypothetical protein
MNTTPPPCETRQKQIRTLAALTLPIIATPAIFLVGEARLIFGLLFLLFATLFIAFYWKTTPGMENGGRNHYIEDDCFVEKRGKNIRHLPLDKLEFVIHRPKEKGSNLNGDNYYLFFGHHCWVRIYSADFFYPGLICEIKNRIDESQWCDKPLEEAPEQANYLIDIVTFDYRNFVATTWQIYTIFFPIASIALALLQKVERVGLYPFYIIGIYIIFVILYTPLILLARYSHLKTIEQCQLARYIQ